MKYPPRDFSLENAVKAVKQVLTENPEGLQISQLSGLARLSANSTKKALYELDAEQDGDIWFLPADPNAKPEPLPEPVPAPAPRPEPVEVTKADVQDLPAPVVAQLSETAQKLVDPITTNENVPLLQRIKKLFENNPEGLSLAEILEQLKCDRKKFDGSLNYIRSTWFPVELKTCGDGVRRYIPHPPVPKPALVEIVDAPIASLSIVENTEALSTEPVSCTVIQEPTKNIQEHEEIMLPDAEFMHKHAENIQPEPVATAEHQQGIVAQLLASRIAVQTIPITREEVELVLKEAFGFDDVQWNHQSGRMTGVTLSREVSLSHAVTGSGG